MIYPHIHNDSCRFRVWAPQKESMTLHLEKNDAPLSMTKDKHGYFYIDLPGVVAGDRYRYQVESGPLYADPCSAFQPEGVHGPSAVVDHNGFTWADEQYFVPPLASLIFYELHIGAFTPEGTLEAIIPRLPDLAELGINAIELMPVAQNPGRRNWGYDSVFLYAVADNYGGPEALRKFVDACHRHRIAVFLDVVYNHIGGEGNILSFFGPYFSDTYQTPWGKALNFDGPWSDGVREFVISNILFWAECYHIDGLRLDAIHEIFDRNAISIWMDIHTAVEQWCALHNRPFYLIAESDLNSPRVISCPQLGGMGLDAQWLDDFHHSLYVRLDPDGSRHYPDFGRIQQLAKVYSEGFVHSGDYMNFRHRRHGASSAGISGSRFVAFNQNHDIPGNRPDGARLGHLVGEGEQMLAAAALLLSPYIPLLFMGEEYGETAPFYFFTDYSAKGVEKELIASRKKQFEAFKFEGDPNNPQDIEVFLASRLHWEQRGQGQHAALLDWYKRLIYLRRTQPLLADLSKTHFRCDLLQSDTLCLYRESADGVQRLICLFNIAAAPADIIVPYDTHATTQWQLQIASHPLPAAVNQTLTLPPWGIAVYAIAAELPAQQ